MPTNAQLDALPTSTKALRAALLAEANQQMQIKFMTPPLLTDDDMVFEQAATVLWDPNLSPDLRAALYKVLAGHARGAGQVGRHRQLRPPGRRDQPL